MGTYYRHKPLRARSADIGEHRTPIRAPPSASRTLALTGATGFIGGRLLAHLTTAGWSVRALMRTPAQRAQHEAVEWVPGSLEDSASLERLLDGVDAVVHCAGAVRGANRADFLAANADGVGRLASIAAARSPAPFFALISSLAAREPALSDYADSKREGELTLAGVAETMPWVALRPPVVYGPGDREVAPLFSWMSRGIAPVAADGTGRFSLLYVDDLCEAVIRCLDGPAGTEGRIFELHDGHAGGYQWHEVVAAAARHFQRRVRRLNIHPALLRAVAALNLTTARLCGYAPMLTPGKVREICHPDWVCDNGSITATTGWVPHVDLAQGLARAFPRRQ